MLIIFQTLFFAYADQQSPAGPYISLEFWSELWFLNKIYKSFLPYSVMPELLHVQRYHLKYIVCLWKNLIAGQRVSFYESYATLVLLSVILSMTQKAKPSWTSNVGNEIEPWIKKKFLTKFTVALQRLVLVVIMWTDCLKHSDERKTWFD